MRYRHLRAFALAFAEAERELPTGAAAPTLVRSEREGTAQAQISSILDAVWYMEGQRTVPDPNRRFDERHSVLLDDLELRIVGVGGVGKEATVYQARDARRRCYALKITHPTRDQTMIDEPLRFDRLNRLGICPSPYIAHGSDYVLKRWVEGTVGDAWLNDDAMSGDGIRALASFVRRCASAHVYVADLKPRNMVLGTYGVWHCIDPGKIIKTDDAMEAWTRLERYVLKHWCDVRPYYPRYLAARYF